MQGEGRRHDDVVMVASGGVVGYLARGRFLHLVGGQLHLLLGVVEQLDGAVLHLDNILLNDAPLAVVVRGELHHHAREPCRRYGLLQQPEVHRADAVRLGDNLTHVVLFQRGDNGLYGCRLVEVVPMEDAHLLAVLVEDA